MGVYWEKSKPIYGSNPVQTLETGLIRIIGRYWTKDSTYIVKLMTKKNNLENSINLKIKKPTDLVTGQPNYTYSLTQDVKGAPLNIDSLCIIYGGSYGIPPQVIKGQMYHEADTHNHRINPTYRYEPFKNLEYQGNSTNNRNYFGTQNNFVITETSMGNGDPIPNTHTNIKPIDYPRDPIHINIFLANNIWQYVQRRSRRVFYSNPVASKMNSYLTKRYDIYVLQNPNNDQNFDRAVRDLAIKCETGGFSELNRIAQTRIMSSYGFLQQTFYNASEPGHQFNGFTRTAATTT